MKPKSLKAMVEVVGNETVLTLMWSNATFAEAQADLRKAAQAVAGEWGAGCIGTEPLPRKAEPVTDHRQIVIGYQSPGYNAKITIRSRAPEAREVLEKVALNSTY